MTQFDEMERWLARQQRGPREISLETVRQTPLPGGVREIELVTSDGTATGIYHDAPQARAAVLWVGGAIGGFNGAAGCYATLGRELTASGISSLRLSYRYPNELPECVVDALFGIGYLVSRGVERLALVGHSFGGAVVIQAGIRAPHVQGVVTLASQTAGALGVEHLAPRPLLLVHGEADTRLPPECSRMIYDMAGEPKRLVLYPGANHALLEAQEPLETLLREWLPATLGQPAPPAVAPPAPRRWTVDRGHGPRTVEVRCADIAAATEDAIVSPATNELTLSDGVGLRLAEVGGHSIREQARRQAPAMPGQVIVTAAGTLPTQQILHAVLTVAQGGFALPTLEEVALATRAALMKAASLGLGSVALPAMGTSGPIAVEYCAAAMLGQLEEHWRAAAGVPHVSFVLGNRGASAAFSEAMDYWTEEQGRT